MRETKRISLAGSRPRYDRHNRFFCRNSRLLLANSVCPPKPGQGLFRLGPPSYAVCLAFQQIFLSFSVHETPNRESLSARFAQFPQVSAGKWFRTPRRNQGGAPPRPSTKPANAFRHAWAGGAGDFFQRCTDAEYKIHGPSS